MRIVQRLVMAMVLGAGLLGHAQEQPKTGDAQVVNSICPVGKEPIDNATFEEWGGVRVGFCCKECVATFRAWSDTRKNAYVTKARQEAGGTKEMKSQEPRADASLVERAGAYPLTTCIVTGEALGSMGEPVKRVYDGREVVFCCDSCVPRFEKDKATYLRALDAEVVRTQKALYPLKTCVVSGKALGTRGDVIELVYRNRLVLLGGAASGAEFEKDPPRFLALLDKAAADAQRASYPLVTCPITKKKLGSMGEPAEMVIAGRLVRLCCQPCEPKVAARAWETLGMIEKASAKGK